MALEFPSVHGQRFPGIPPSLGEVRPTTLYCDSVSKMRVLSVLVHEHRRLIDETVHGRARAPRRLPSSDLGVITDRLGHRLALVQPWFSLHGFVSVGSRSKHIRNDQ